MDKDKKLKMKSRAGQKRLSVAEKDERVKGALAREREIAETLRDMNRELLILMKTNHYLRQIDMRLGNPTNTFNQVNNVTWKIFIESQGKTLSTIQYYRHIFNFYYLKFGLWCYGMSIQLRHMLGFEIAKEDLENFELDYTEHTNVKNLP